jgi:hypothetical protein
MEDIMLKLPKLMVLASMLFMPLVARAELALSDFEGNFSSYSYSVGGISGKSGLSLSSVAQISFDKHGNGKFNFLSYSTYTGPIGTRLKTRSTPDKTATHAKIKVKITDPKHYVGTMTIYDYPMRGAILYTDFVALKRNGKVSEFNENVISNPEGEKGGAMLVFNKRQSWYHPPKKPTNKKRGSHTSHTSHTTHSPHSPHKHRDDHHTSHQKEIVSSPLKDIMNMASVDDAMPLVDEISMTERR